MDLDFPKNPDELFNFFRKEREKNANLRDELNHDIVDKKVRAIGEKRIFFQNIAIASATLLGIASIFSSFSRDVLLFQYFIIGLALHLGVICIVFVYIRGTIDQDLEELTSLQDNYGLLLQETIKLAEEFLLPALKTQNEGEIKNLMVQYSEKLTELQSVKKLNQDNEKLDKDRNSRISGTSEMEFYGELITFLFVLGILFIIAAIAGKPLNWICITSGIVGVFLFTFTDFLNMVSKPFFRLFTYLRLHSLFKNKRY